jgi:ribosomal protein S18 acetylase RimI-like enzyme
LIIASKGRLGARIMGVEIRNAVRADERRLAALDRLTWSPTVAPVPLWDEQVDFFANEGPDDVLVAVANEELVGYVKLRRPTALRSNRHVLQIGGLAVHPGHQGRGVGRRLVLAAAAEAQRRGAVRLTLHVLGTNTPARNLYAACGFEIEGVLRGEFLIADCSVDDVLMALPLQSNTDGVQSATPAH